MGRLVETPKEIIAFIDTFLAGQNKTANNGLVTGYDFLIDARLDMRDRLSTGGVGNVGTLINNGWNRSDLIRELLQTDVDVASLNVHADHWGLGTPHDFGVNSTDIVTASAVMSRAVYYTLGCHTGLNIPDQDSNPRTTLDLAQTFLRRGANWIANTGYSIGGDGTPLSEQVMLFLTAELVAGSQQAIGPALVRAKQRYLPLVLRNGPQQSAKKQDKSVLSALPAIQRIILDTLSIGSSKQPIDSSESPSTILSTRR